MDKYETIGLIAVIGAGIVVIAIPCVICWIWGWLVANKEYMTHLDNDLEIARRAECWANIRHCQAQFNVDFFEELWAANDFRLGIR